MTSFAEVAATYRRFRFIHFGDGMEDDSKQMPLIPLYNTQKYKTECMTYLSSPTTGRGCLEVVSHI